MTTHTHHLYIHYITHIYDEMIVHITGQREENMSKAVKRQRVEESSENLTSSTMTAPITASSCASSSADADEDENFIGMPPTVVCIIDICRGAGLAVLNELTSGYATSVWKQAMGVQLRMDCVDTMFYVSRDVAVDILYRHVRLDSITVDYVVSQDGRPVMYVFVQRKTTKHTSNDLTVLYTVQEQIYKQTNFKPWCMLLHFMPSTLKTVIMYDGKVLDETSNTTASDSE